VLAVVCGFLFFYGLGAFGLVGADEPRYAQVARECSNTTTGHAHAGPPTCWKKPPSFTGRDDRVSPVWRERLAARLPSAFSALLMIVAIYWFLRFPARFGVGWRADDRIVRGRDWIRASAATDMPLTANFTIALLAWYAWHESQERAGWPWPVPFSGWRHWPRAVPCLFRAHRDCFCSGPTRSAADRRHAVATRRRAIVS